jgi:iron complex outermembrane receptor protein
VDVDDVFNSQDISIIEEWQPEDHINLNARYSRDALSVNLGFSRYGEYTVTDGGSQTYGAELLTDLYVSYLFDNGIRINLSGNNIFDVYPDKTTIGRSRNGAIENGPNGELIIDSDGVFVYSRRSVPFGFNGAYYSLGFSWDF